MKFFANKTAALNLLSKPPQSVVLIFDRKILPALHRFFLLPQSRYSEVGI